MISDFISLILVVMLLEIVVFVFIRISIRLRKRGGSLTSVLFGGTYEFYGKDQRAAIQEIVEQKSEKKKKEQESGDDEDSEGFSIDNDIVIKKIHPKKGMLEILLLKINKPKVLNLQP